MISLGLMALSSFSACASTIWAMLSLPAVVVVSAAFSAIEHGATNNRADTASISLMAILLDLADIC